MPEYLAPGVYVEEVDTGAKPIEGVSTSTAGIVGVAERGPLNIPILVTSYGEFGRIFGGKLPFRDFSEHCYLPYAVEGFFQNGGKRLFVVRVLSTDAATKSWTFLFDREAVSAVSTRLFHRSEAESETIYTLNNAGLAAGTWLQIGTGSDAEYVQVQGTTPAAPVFLDLPLAGSHAVDDYVARLDHPVTENNPASGPYTLSENAAIGARSIVLERDATGDLHENDLLRITTDNGIEFCFVSEDPTSEVVNIRFPLMVNHISSGATNEVARIDINAQDETEIESEVLVGDRNVSIVVATNYVDGDFVLIGTGEHREVRTIVDGSHLSMCDTTVGAYSDYQAGSEIEPVTVNDDGDIRALDADAEAGTNVILLDNRVNLTPGTVIRIGATPETVEYIRIRDLPDRLAVDDPGQVILECGLQNRHIAVTPVAAQTVQVLAPPTPTILEFPTTRNINQLVLRNADQYTNGMLLRVTATDGRIFYHRLANAPTDMTPTNVTLATPLDQAHPTSAAVVSRNPILRVEALDQGGWGDRLRVAIRDARRPLLNTEIRGIVNSQNIRLAASNGIEAGTVLRLLDADGNPTGTPLKVINVDPANDFLITLDPATPLPAANMGDPIRTHEFDLLVYLLARPDPTRPERADTVIGSENFTALSMDPRHSRYIETVIGTTWQPMAVDDDNGNPLRLADRRSQGGSIYIRVRDQAHFAGNAAAIADALHSVRLGPEALLDTLPDGRQVPARRPLEHGNDALNQMDDSVYIGTRSDQPENRTGIHSLQNEDDISIIGCPGRTGTLLQQTLIQQCQLLRYRFSVLDSTPPPLDSLNDAQRHRQSYDTKYAAIYYPWALIPDPFPINRNEPTDFGIPVSGHILGVYARTDIQRGVHKAPANEVLRGVTGLSRVLNKSEHDLLNPSPVNINVIRDFRRNNRGIRVWGGRVITSDTDWKYVNVRRLLIFIEASIDRGLQWVVFEPNAEPLWARVRRSISNFLTTVWRNGALEGTSVEEAFYVKCDRTTMTQTDIDNGKLICEIGVAPVKPAEFVIIRIGLWTAHAED